MESDFRRWIRLVNSLKIVEMTTEKDAPRFKGGKQKNRDAWGIIDNHPDAKKIKKWWHREKDFRGGHDMTKEDAEDIIGEWERRGYDYDTDLNEI